MHLDGDVVVVLVLMQPQVDGVVLAYVTCVHQLKDLKVLG
jgi:hypothetical protein